MNKALVLLALSHLSLLPAALAKAQNQVETIRLFEDVGTWPGSAPPAVAFDRIASGNLTGGVGQDVAVLRGGELHVMYRPGEFDTILHVASGVVDAVVLPGTGGSFPDAIFAVDGSTAKLWSYSSSSSSFTGTTLSLAGWGTAQNLWFDGVDSLWALASDGVTLKHIELSGGNLVVQSDVTIPVGVQDVGILDWEGDSDDDLALLYLGVLHVVSYTGSGSTSTLATLSTYIGDRIAVSRGFGGEPDLLAWKTYQAGLGTVIKTMNGTVSGPQIDPPLALGMPVGGMAAVRNDTGSVQRMDVLLSIHGSRDVWILTRKEPLASQRLVIEPAPAEVYYGLSPVNAGPAFQETLVGSADVDGDGDMDPVFGISEDSSLRVYHSMPANYLHLVPRVRFGFEPLAGQLVFDVEVRRPLLEPGTLWTHAWITIWSQPDINQACDPQAIGGWLVQLPQGWGKNWAILTASVPPSFPSTGVFQVHVRAVTLNQGAPDLQGPAAVAYHSSSAATSLLLENLPEVLEMLDGNDEPILAGNVNLASRGRRTPVPPALPQ